MMKIVFFSKRRPMGRDLVTRPYGRFYHLPRLMAGQGHQVFVLLLSYARDGRLEMERDGITWISESVYPTGPFRYLARADATVKKLEPDWVVGFSDTYYGILAVKLSRKHGTNSVIDAYDNYESYVSWLTPLHSMWRKAISEADLVTVAGPQLGQYLDTFRPAHGRASIVVPMAADPAGFNPMDQDKCRNELNLPLKKRLIGYCGSIHRNRGIETLFQAFEQLQKTDDDIELLLTGRKDKAVRLPPGVRWLGYIPDNKVAVVLNSVDVLVVVNQLSDFGRFSYPVKLYEAMSCRVPVVASDTQAANWILDGKKGFLARPGNPLDMAEKIRRLLPLGRVDYGVQNTWQKSCDVFLEVLNNGRATFPSRARDSCPETGPEKKSCGDALMAECSSAFCHIDTNSAYPL